MTSCTPPVMASTGASSSRSEVLPDTLFSSPDLADVLVVSDFDGTISLRDTLTVLCDHNIGRARRRELDQDILHGRTSFVDGCEEMFRGYSIPLAESMRMIVEAARERATHLSDAAADAADEPAAADAASGAATPAAAAAAAAVVIDPAFAEFARWCESRGLPLVIVSSGFKTIISTLLEPLGLGHIPVYANDVSIGDDGAWKLVWDDDSHHGHDKEATVGKLMESTGRKTVVYLGDGISDVPVARSGMLAHILTKDGKQLTDWCLDNGAPHTPFKDFRHAIELFTAAVGDEGTSGAAEAHEGDATGKGEGSRQSGATGGSAAAAASDAP